MTEAEVPDKDLMVDRIARIIAHKYIVTSPRTMSHTTVAHLKSTIRRVLGGKRLTVRERTFQMIFRYPKMKSIAVVHYWPITDRISSIKVSNLDGGPADHEADVKVMARRDYLTSRAAVLQARAMAMLGRRDKMMVMD